MTSEYRESALKLLRSRDTIISHVDKFAHRAKQALWSNSRVTKQPDRFKIKVPFPQNLPVNFEIDLLLFGPPVLLQKECVSLKWSLSKAERYESLYRSVIKVLHHHDCLHWLRLRSEALSRNPICLGREKQWRIKHATQRDVIMLFIYLHVRWKSKRFGLIWWNLYEVCRREFF